MEACDICKYALALKEEGTFECRRHAPQSWFGGGLTPGFASWPRVKADDFCGEFARNDRRRAA